MANVREIVVIGGVPVFVERRGAMTLDGTDGRVATNTRPRTPEGLTLEESYR